MKFRFILILLLWLTACTSQTPQPQDSSAPTSIEKSALPTSLPTTPEPVSEMLTDVVVMDLSKRIPIASDAIRVISVESAVWSDSGLGCPLPDQVYIQGSISGYQVQLDAEGQIYEYHIVDDGEYFTLCATDYPIGAPLPTLPGKPGSDTDTTPWVPVN
ncbi:MAG: hypothetical protein QM730_06940 [Anaerolineales bacterium]